MRLNLILALCVGGLSLTGCATSRDVRTLQLQIDELQAEQDRVVQRIAHLDSLNRTEGAQTRQLVVDLKHTAADMTTRLDQIDAQIDDLGSRLTQAPRTPITPQVNTPDIVSQTADSLPLQNLSADAQQRYHLAFEALRREQYDAAVGGFRMFLRDRPGAPEAGSAVYWIAESFYAQGKADSALAQFRAVVDQYPESDKLPAALYKIGNIYEERDDKKSAFPYYRRLKEEFPQSLEYQQLRRKLGE